MILTKQKSKLKSPLSGYYGGKHYLSKYICSLIPEHEIYIEPFFGGGSVFFKKPKSNMEVINDIDFSVYNFWNVCKNRTKDFYTEILNADFSERSFKESKENLKKNNKNDLLSLAKSFFIVTNLSFNKNIMGYFSKKNHKNIKAIKDKINQIYLSGIRLKNTEIFNKDACEIIKEFSEKKNAFFYLDPPYPGADQRYNCKYNNDDFIRLIHALNKIKGKFLLSCYVKNGISDLIKYKVLNKTVKLWSYNSKRYQEKPDRTESFILNYDVPGKKE